MNVKNFRNNTFSKKTTIAGFSGYTTTRKTTDYLEGFQYLKTENIGGGGSSEMLMASSLSQKAMQPLAFSLDEKRVPPPAKTPDLQFFPTTEGFYDYIKDQYIYQYKDHLGNNRISFGRDSGGNLEIVDANDYYPFGMNHLKSGNAFFGQSSYKNYKFLSQELQEMGFYDLNARQYLSDAVIFTQHDPLSEKTLQPYAYGYNNPIRYGDHTGRSPVDWIRQSINGQTSWTYDANITTSSQAAAAGYQGVTGVYSSATVSMASTLGIGGYSYGLNAGGSVTNNSDGSAIYNTFTTGAGTIINAPSGTFMSEHKMDFWEGWANNDNFAAKLTYNIANSAYVTAQVFDGGLMERSEWANPLGGNYGNLDGTPNYHQEEGFVNTLSLVYSSVRGLASVKEFATEGLQVTSKMNAAQFSSTFKGTAISRAAPATRGIMNRYLNKGIGYVNGQVESGMKAPTVVKSVGNMFNPKDEKQ